jgi:Uncharacterized protein family UPF0016
VCASADKCKFLLNTSTSFILSVILRLIYFKAQTSGFLQSFLLIFVSEIGDKTFFIAGLLAAKYNRLISFTGSIGMHLPTYLNLLHDI